MKSSERVANNLNPKALTVDKLQAEESPVVNVERNHENWGVTTERNLEGDYQAQSTVD